MDRICFLVGYNLYDTKRAFTESLAAALRQRGVSTAIVEVADIQLSERNVEQILQTKPDLTCSFNSINPVDGGSFLWDFLKIPHLSLLVDPSIYSLELTRSPYSLVSCVDYFDNELLANTGFEHSFFFGHGVDNELVIAGPRDKVYDVVFVGSSYDPEVCLQRWKHSYDPKVQTVLHEASQRTLSEPETAFTQALSIAIKEHQIQDPGLDFVELAREVDTYTRALDRVELLRNIKDAEVHVFGGRGWQDGEEDARDWRELLDGKENIVVHPSVAFEQAQEIMRQSKICLNSMPFFKHGTHERVLLALAAEAVVVSSPSSYLESYIEDERGFFTYTHGKWDELNTLLRQLLSDESSRQEAAERGRKVVGIEHSWHVRAGQLIDACGSLLESIANESYVRTFDT